jgi:hypothetical protein
MNSKLYNRIFGECGVSEYEGEEAGTEGRYDVNGIDDEGEIADKPRGFKSIPPSEMKAMTAQGGQDGGDIGGDDDEPDNEMQTERDWTGPENMGNTPEAGGDNGIVGGTRTPINVKAQTPSGMFESGSLYTRIFGNPETYTDLEEVGNSEYDSDDYISESETPERIKRDSLYSQIFGQK